MVVDERPHGVFSRQLFLGETLSLDQVEANYDAGVLTVRIPEAEPAKPRKIEIGRGDEAKEIAG
jgi:HSP20 family protein